MDSWSSLERNHGEILHQGRWKIDKRAPEEVSKIWSEVCFRQMPKLVSDKASEKNLGKMHTASKH